MQANGGTGSTGNAANVVADYTALLTDRSWVWSGVTNQSAIVTYSFDTVPDDDRYYTKEYLATFRPFTEAERDVTRAAFQQWDDASGLTFIEVSSGNGDIGLGVWDTALSPFAGTQNAAGFANYPTKLVDADNDCSAYRRINITMDNDYRDLSSFEYVALHEIGHAIGFKHPFEGGPFEGGTVLRGDLDNNDNTVMSYTYTGPASGRLGSMDVQAARHLYGTDDYSHLSSWGWDAPSENLTQVGTNENDQLSGVGVRDVIISGAGDDVVAGFDGDDDLYGEAGDDYIDGGVGTDFLDGGAGDDRLIGADGDDNLLGGKGHDHLEGGAGIDHLDGGAGNDTFILDYEENAQDTYLGGDGQDVLRTYFPEVSQLILDAAASIEILDTSDVNIRGTAGDDVIDLSGVAVVAGTGQFFMGDGNDLFMGSASDDIVWAEAGDDRFFGRAGDDYLGGGAGRDHLDGGTGTDIAFFNDQNMTAASIITVGGPTVADVTYVAQFVSGDVDTLVSIEFIGSNELPFTNPNTFIRFDGLTYVATFTDLAGAFSGSAAEVNAAGAWHFAFNGLFEGRGGEGVVRFDAGQYKQNYGDLAGLSDEDATLHYVNSGVYEGRLGFDAMVYIASYGDLADAFGTNEAAGVAHYQGFGRAEGRGVTFDAGQYLDNYDDLRAVFGRDEAAATTHFVAQGRGEGRTDIDPLDYVGLLR